jgi:hypothetical protein
MYSHLVARVKGEEDYQFYRYTGPTMMLNFRGKEEPISKGDKFGVRKSSDGKKIRLIMDDNLSRVFTISLPEATSLSKHVSAV